MGLSCNCGIPADLCFSVTCRQVIIIFLWALSAIRISAAGSANSIQFNVTSIYWASLNCQYWSEHLGNKVKNFLAWGSSQSREEDKPWRKESPSLPPEELIHLILRKMVSWTMDGSFAYVQSKFQLSWPILNIEI